MQITAFILLTVSLTAAAAGNAQPITLDVRDAPLEKVFAEIKKQTGYSFVYYKNDLAKAGKITLKLTSPGIDEILKLVFQDQPLIYTIVDKTIVIKQKPARAVNNDHSPLANILPPIDVRGRVVNENGEPVLASIQVKGTNTGTVSKTDGYFELKGIDANATLIITATNIETREVQLKGRSDLALVNVKMKISPLDETQVIAYGTKSRRFQTANVSSVKGTDIEKSPVTNPILALQGRVPGLTVTQSNGIAGSGLNIRVQGRNNLNSVFTGSDPLIVIDGVPYPSQNLLTFQTGGNASSVSGTVLGQRNSEFEGAGSTLAFINPDDIESIDVLKDADATAIYGSRAANGAILITTKKGKAGETKIDVNFQTGWGKVAHKMDLLNTQQYLQMRREAKKNDNANVLSTDFDLNGHWDSTRYTDWQEEMIGGTANFTRASAGISGGSLNTKYLIGGTYSRETTVFPGDFANTKGAVHFNISSATSNNRLQVQLTGSFLNDNNQLPAIDFTRFIALSPVAPKLYNSDGTLNWQPLPNGNSSWDNPLSYNYNLFENKATNLISNSIISYRILNGVEIKASLGYNQLQSNQFVGALDASFRPERRATRTRSATFVDNTIKTWIAEPQLSYSKNFKTLGRLEALAGVTFQETSSDGLQITGVGQSSDDLLRNLAAASSYGSLTIKSDYRYNAVFGRLNYMLKNRYLLNLSARRDGSSRFGSKNLFHNFGAVGAGWIFSEELFVKNFLSFLSYGKLRGSYGVMGNDQIGDYNFMSLYQSTFNAIPYQALRGLEPTAIANPYLQWEETKKLQAGIDLGFINDRILVSANYFRNRSGNTLSSVALPFITGADTYLDNFDALIQNTGWEFSFRSENLKRKNFQWITTFNLTIPRNKLVAFPNLAGSTSSYELIVGKSLNINQLFSYHSIDPQTGGFLFTDSSGNITATPNFLTDRISVTDMNEQLYGGLINSISFKGFALDFLFQFIKQKASHVLNFGQAPGRFNSSVVLGNQPTSVLERWQKPGDIAGAPRYKSTGADHIPGNWALRDASFVRLKNISLSYKFPQGLLNRAGVKDAALFVNGQNLLTFTKYKGLDPETKSVTSLPPLRMITVGVKLGL